MLLSYNLIPDKNPVISIPPILKLTALAVTILGLFAALELQSFTTKKFTSPPLNLHHFPTLLGFFPTLVHRLAPQANLALGQTISNQMIDQTSAEKVIPKAVISLTTPLVTLTGNIQQDLIKTYFIFFTITLALTVPFALVMCS